MAAMPEVVTAAVSSNATPPANGNDARFEFLGRPDVGSPEIRLNFISSEYFSLLRIPLLQGRIWDDRETMRAAALAVINESMARQYWPNGDAVGHQLRTPDLIDQPPTSPSAPGSTGWLQIVGIVADSRNNGMRSPIVPAIYIPYSLHTWMGTQLLVRTHTSPLSAIQDMRIQIAAVDPDQQVISAHDLRENTTFDSEYAQQRLVATLFGIFSIFALTLAVVGLYSVVSYAVATRTNEFGVRLALGATARDIARLVLSATTATVALGLIAGIALSVALSKFFSAWVNQSSRDPLLLSAVALVLLFAALLAASIPALRASRTDPMLALRHD
jgi:hypothetical protein